MTNKFHLMDAMINLDTVHAYRPVILGPSPSLSPVLPGPILPEIIFGSRNALDCVDMNNISLIFLLNRSQNSNNFISYKNAEKIL